MLSVVHLCCSVLYQREMMIFFPRNQTYLSNYQSPPCQYKPLFLHTALLDLSLLLSNVQSIFACFLSGPFLDPSRESGHDCTLQSAASWPLGPPLQRGRALPADHHGRQRTVTQADHIRRKTEQRC